jgi:hypothetical protein
MFKLIYVLFLFTVSFACKRAFKKVENDDKNDTIITKSKDTFDKIRFDSIQKTLVIKFPNNCTNCKEIILEPYFKTSFSKNEEILDTAWGDLNFDEKKDFILVSKFKNENKYAPDSDTSKRTLFIYIHRTKEQFDLVSKNENAIPQNGSCGMSDPYAGVSITDGSINVFQYCASNCKGVSKFSFRYVANKKNWILNKLVHESYCFDFRDYDCDSVLSKDLRHIAIDRFDINLEYNQIVTDKYYKANK